MNEWDGKVLFPLYKGKTVREFGDLVFEKLGSLLCSEYADRWPDVKSFFIEWPTRFRMLFPEVLCLNLDYSKVKLGEKFDVHKQGYLRLSLGKGLPVLVHQLVAWLCFGPAPMDPKNPRLKAPVMHLCDNKCCVAPSHLLYGSHEVNMSQTRIHRPAESYSPFNEARELFFESYVVPPQEEEEEAGSSSNTPQEEEDALAKLEKLALV